MKIKYNLALGVLLVIVAAIAYLVPLERTAAYWICLGFAALSIVAQLFVSSLAAKSRDTLRSKFYGFPILMVGHAYITFAMAAAILFILMSGLIVGFPVWVVLLTYIVGTGAAAIGLLATTGSRDYIVRQDQKVQANTAFMRGLVNVALTLKNGNTNRELAPMLEKLYESIRYSDPVSAPMLAEYEGELMRRFEAVQAAVSTGDAEAVNSACARFDEQLQRRNALCKSVKD